MEERPLVVRLFECVVAVTVLVYAVRTALPFSPGVYLWWWRVPSALLLALPGVVLLRFPGSDSRRRKALIGLSIAHAYWATAILWGDLTRFGSATTTLGMSVFALILYAGERQGGRA